MDASAMGRQHLADWLSAQPDDLYAADPAFQALVDHHGLEHEAEHFHRVGRTVAGPLDAAACESNLHQNLPRVLGHDAIGRPDLSIDHHPSWREAEGRLMWEVG